jgi:hypothetical protein
MKVFTGTFTKLLNRASACCVGLLLLATAQHTEAASGITYTGRILDANDAPVVASNVRFTIILYDALGKCWLYNEQRDLDLSQSDGTFSFDVGSSDASLVGGTANFNGSATGPQNLTDLFNNLKSFSALGTANGCSGTYTPNPSDPTAGRVLSVYFSVAGGPNQALPLLKVNPVPSALQAYSINGYGSGELLKVNPSVNQGTNPNTALTQTQYDEFWRLITNPLAAYLPLSGDVTVVGANNKLTTLLGQALPAGPATNGQVLVSNGTAWVLQSMSGGSVASVTGTAPVVVGGTASAPVVSMPAATTSADGYLTSADWNTFNSKQSSTLASGKILVGNGSNLATEVSMSGDATMSNTGAVTLKNTGTAGTYGSATLVPVVTTDAQGRVTGVTTAAPLDATKLPLAGGTMTGAIAMGGFDITNAGNISMAASKTLGLSSNAADPGTPAAGQVWYNSTSNVIKFYDGTSVQSLGVAGAGLTSLNGLNAGTQTFAIGTSGTAPGFSSATSTHTLNIPMASTAAVTAGLISKTDYDAFNTKLGAVTNTATLAPTKIWIGDVGSKAQEFALSGDATMSSGGVVTVDKTQAAAASKILQLTASSVAVTKGTDIGGAGAGVAHILYPNTATNTTLTLPGTAGSASQFLQTDGAGNLTWAAPSATLPGLASTLVWVGNASGGAAAVALSGDIASIDNAGLVTANKTTTAQANKLLSLDGSSVATASGMALVNTGTVTLSAQTASSTYGLRLPAAAPAANQSLQSDASGNLSWVAPLSSSTAYVNGGNTFAGNASIGTNDNYNLDLKTNNTSRMTILNNGNVGIATTSPVTALEVVDTTGVTSRGITSTTYSTNPGGLIQTRGARGTPAAPTALLSGDTYGWFAFAGYDGSAFSVQNEPTGLNAFTSQTWTATAHGSGVRIITTPNGTTAGQERMKIDQNGNVGIGTISPSQKLDVSGNISTNGKSPPSFFPNGAIVAYNPTGNASYGSGMSVLVKETSFGGFNIGYETSAPNKWIIGISNGSSDRTGLSFFEDSMAANPRLTLATGGNVGIGTTTPGALLDVGLAGTTLGTLRLEGNTSGYVQVQPAAAAGSWTMTLPANAGTNGYVLTTNGSGVTSWTSSLTNTLTSGKILVGNASNVATEQTLSGDISAVSDTGSVTVDKTQAAAASKILQLTASSVAVTKGTDIGGAGAGVAHILYPNTATDTTLTLPGTAGSASQFLQTDGAGNLTWAAPSATLPGLASTLVWVGNASGGAAAVALSGDIASIDNAGLVTANKTTTAQANKLLSLDGSSVATASGMALVNTGTVTLSAQTASSTYGLKLPAAAPAANQSLQSDASGNLSWVTSLTSSTAFINGGNTFAGNSSIGTNDNYNLDLETNGTSRMTILNNGNVGIGTATPTAPLELSSIFLPTSGEVNVEKVNTTFSAVLPSTATVRGVYSNFTTASASSLSGAQAEAGNFKLTHGSTVTLGKAYAVNASINNSTTGTISDAEGLSSWLDNGASSTITTAYGARLKISNAGTLTTAYGLYIDTIAGTNKWGLYQSDSTNLNYFAGNVGIGTTTPAANLEVVTTSATMPRGIYTTQYSTDNEPAVFGTRKARGTSSAPTAVTSGDNIFAFGASAYDGSAFQVPGYIGFVVNGAVAAGSVPTDFIIRTGTAANGTERFRINASGNVGIGTTNPPSKFIVTPPSVETIAAGAVITADACGTIKLIQSTGNVTTDTTNTFTAPTASYNGCCMDIINMNTVDTITLDQNALFKTTGNVNQQLGPDGTIRVCSNGTSWHQIGQMGNQ